MTTEKQTDTPKLLRDMSEAELGALMSAELRGKTIQYFDISRGIWHDSRGGPLWAVGTPYRVKPESQPITLHGVDLTYHSLHPIATTGYEGDFNRMTFTFPTIDGKHIPGVYTSPDGLKVIVEVAK